MEPITIDQAYFDGRQAFEDGFDIYDNPYKEDWLVGAWGNGWYSAQKDKAEWLSQQ